MGRRAGANLAGMQGATLNAPIGYLEQLVTLSVLDGRPVWFASDYTSDADTGVGRTNQLINGLFDYELLLGTSFQLTKAQRLAYRQSWATHAMVITGFDAFNGTVTKFLVDNSHGEKAATLAMSSSWFREYVFFIAVD